MLEGGNGFRGLPLSQESVSSKVLETYGLCAWVKHEVFPHEYLESQLFRESFSSDHGSCSQCGDVFEILATVILEQIEIMWYT